MKNCACVLGVFILFLHSVRGDSDSGMTTNSSAYFMLRRELRSREAVVEKVPPGGMLKKVRINVSITPLDILDVDDVRQVVTLSAVVLFKWTDPALSWNASSEVFGNISYVELSIEDVWLPSFMLMNGASADDRNLKPFINDVVPVSSSGQITIVASHVLSFSCKMDMKRYPFDTQTCNMMLFIYSQVGIDARSVDGSALGLGQLQQTFAVSAEWTLENMTVERKVVQPLDDILLQYVWTVKRKTTFFVISFIVPIVMTSYMNVLVFLIPADSGEKISYLVSIFVSNAVFLGFCTNQMPQGLDSVPLVMYLVLGVMAESGVLIVMTSYILTRFQRECKVDGTAGSVSQSYRSGQRPASANSVAPLEGNTKQEKNQKMWKRTLTALSVTAVDKTFFCIAFVINTIFVTSVLFSIH